MTKYLGEYIYTKEEKRSHLIEFVDALELLLASDILLSHFSESMANLAECHCNGELLLEAGFTQDDLTKLSRSFQPSIHLHPHWDPPLLQDSSGEWQTPDWYPGFEQLHVRVADAAHQLRVLGELRYSE